MIWVRDLKAPQYTKQILENIRIESNNNFVNDSIINDVIHLTKCNSSNIDDLVVASMYEITAIKRFDELCEKAEPIQNLKELLAEPNRKDLVEAFLLCFI